MRRPSLESSIKLVVSSIALGLILSLTGTTLYVDYRDRIVREEEAIRTLVPQVARLSSVEAVALLSARGKSWRIVAGTGGDTPLLRSAEGALWKASPDRAALFADLLHRQRHVLVVAMIGLLLSVEIAVFLAYGLTRPLKRLAWACSEISAGRWVRLPRREVPPFEFALVETTFNDMISRLRQGQELERRMARVERLAALGQVIAGVSHEIRNPLAAIRVHLDLLESSLDGEGQASLALVGRELDRLNGTVSQLLAYGRPPEPIWGPLSVEELFLWCRRMIGPNLSRSKVSLAVETEGDLAFSGDAGRLQQMLLNLALNALAAMEPRGGCLTLAARRKGERIEIEVRDTGRGIAPEIAERLFDPFFTTRPDGTGLGLSIVSRIVEMHEGTLRVRSEEGRTSFIVDLPAKRSGSHDATVDH